MIVPFLWLWDLINCVNSQGTHYRRLEISYRFFGTDTKLFNISIYIVYYQTQKYSSIHSYLIKWANYLIATGVKLVSRVKGTYVGPKDKKLNIKDCVNAICSFRMHVIAAPSPEKKIIQCCINNYFLHTFSTFPWSLILNILFTGTCCFNCKF